MGHFLMSLTVKGFKYYVFVFISHVPLYIAQNGDMGRMIDISLSSQTLYGGDTLLIKVTYILSKQGFACKAAQYPAAGLISLNECLFSNERNYFHSSKGG